MGGNILFFNGTYNTVQIKYLQGTGSAIEPHNFLGVYITEPSTDSKLPWANISTALKENNLALSVEKRFLCILVKCTFYSFSHEGFFHYSRLFMLTYTVLFQNLGSIASQRSHVKLLSPSNLNFSGLIAHPAPCEYMPT